MRNRLRRTIHLLMLAVASYLLIWLLAYSVVMGLDYSQVGRYFVLAWRGDGELPTGIQVLAFMVMAVLLLGVLGLRWCRDRARSKRG